MGFYGIYYIMIIPLIAVKGHNCRGMHPKALTWQLGYDPYWLMVYLPL